ncbi:MAG: carcinine hydrolase/isopenicillin-N N-acyltransferase family protein, partial [Candidatus Hodarchaeota archaeon]
MKEELLHALAELPFDEECSSVIVTGSAAKDGRAILMKNRDWSGDIRNIESYIPATDDTFAYVGVNFYAMGINEKGLAVMNTYMPALEPEGGEGNLILNKWLLENCKTVAEVAWQLNRTGGPIGPGRPAIGYAVATCIGVIDQLGNGAFFEINTDEAYAEYVVDGYQSRANHPRIFPGLASGPSGRDQYLLDILDEVYAKNGVISWEDVMQNASRYVRGKELGSENFTIEGEVCNPATVSSMVAVSGDSRYDGKLNCMWSACGLAPIVGIFVPSVVHAGHVV